MDASSSRTNLEAVVYGTSAPPAFQHVAASAYNFPDTVERLKQAISDADLWLIHEIDPQALLARGGYGLRPTRQLLFFHPRLMVQLIVRNPAAMIEAPLRYIVMEQEDGITTVRFSDPKIALERYEALATIGAEFREICLRILSSVTSRETEATR